MANYAKTCKDGIGVVWEDPRWHDSEESRKNIYIYDECQMFVIMDVIFFIMEFYHSQDRYQVI